MKRARIHALIIAFFAAATVWADDTPEPSDPPKPKDVQLEQARAAIAQKDWARARDVLREAIARNPQNADYHNLYAYAIRKGPDPNMDLVFRHYNEALRIDPKHLGAHEYLGEAYLMLGNVAKAREHLAQLDRLCVFGCEEYTTLKKAIAEFEQRQAKK